MEVLIVSGMSGAGKSKAAACLEDLGFYCVDNMPIELIPQFVDICLKADHKKVMLVMDVRTSKDFSRLFGFIKEKQNVTFKTVFLDAKNSILVNRYKESRRKHPMDKGGQGLIESIAAERVLLEPIRTMADFQVDTSIMSTSNLRDHMLQLFLEKKDRTLMANIMSFGFKHGACTEADLIFDVRFLPNPFYEINLRIKDGTDVDVRDYVFQNGVAEEFMEKLRDMLEFLLPKYIDEGKTSLIIAIGCTGGKHRSVAISEEIYKHVLGLGFSAVIKHRDIGKV